MKNSVSMMHWKLASFNQETLILLLCCSPSIYQRLRPTLLSPENQKRYLQKQICRICGGEDHEADDCIDELKCHKCDNDHMSRRSNCKVKKK